MWIVKTSTSVHLPQPCRVLRSNTTQASRVSLYTPTTFETWVESNPLPTAQTSSESDEAQGIKACQEETADFSKSKRFHWRQSAKLLQQLMQLGDVRWCQQAQRFVCSDSAGAEVGWLELPRVLQALDDSPSAADILQRITGDNGKVKCGSILMVLLSADSAALGIWNEGVLTRHKVLTGYTVRQKQGGSQARYLRRGGGGHSIGGGMRAREIRRLFQGAATKLAAWEGEVAQCRLAFESGDVRVWNEFYASDSPPPPILRNDSRWQPAKLSVRRPRYADLERVMHAVSFGSTNAGLTVRR